MGSLIKLLGSKAVSLMGGALVATGMMLSFFASEPWHIFVTWGFLVGTVQLHCESLYYHINNVV